MNKIIIIIFLMFFTSCSEDIKTAQEKKLAKRGFYKEVNINEDNEMFIFYRNKDGIKEGPFSISYPNGFLEKGYYKNSKFDSVWRLLDSNGTLRVQTYYINGKENGYRTIYTELGNLDENYFVENDIVKTTHEYFYIKINGEIFGYRTNVYLNTDSGMLFTGGLLFDTNKQVLRSINENTKSTFYKFEGLNKTSNGLYCSNINQNDTIVFSFFRAKNNSNLSLRIKTLDSLNQDINNYKEYKIDSTGIFKYPIKNNINGWKFIRGKLHEVDSKGNNRNIPIFINYYVI